VCNPATVGDSISNLEAIKDEHKYKEYMIADITALFYCDAIFMLNGWEESKGARIEKFIAKEVGILELNFDS